MARQHHVHLVDDDWIHEAEAAYGGGEARDLAVRVGAGVARVAAEVGDREAFNALRGCTEDAGGRQCFAVGIFWLAIDD